jgi:hypothetical protein
MAYSSFTVKQVEQQFNLQIITDSFLPVIPPLAPSPYLADLLQRMSSLAAILGTEKARSPLAQAKLSEFIIAPLLFELRELLDRQVGLFTGADFTIDIPSGLNGVCDFLLTRSSSEVSIKAPVVVLIEAKKGELNGGWGQPATQGSEETSEQSVAVCMAEMVAAQRFNQADGQNIPSIYGSVTTGTQWQFLRLTGQQMWIDVTEYGLMPLDRILGILKWMLEN